MPTHPETVVKQLVPMHSKKPQELSYAIQALQQELLLPCRRHWRFPTRDRHLHASSGRAHQITNCIRLCIEKSDFSQQIK
jgi:hypothetical protein